MVGGYISASGSVIDDTSTNTLTLLEKSDPTIYPYLST